MNPLIDPTQILANLASTQKAEKDKALALMDDMIRNLQEAKINLQRDEWIHKSVTGTPTIVTSTNNAVIGLSESLQKFILTRTTIREING